MAKPKANNKSEEQTNESLPKGDVASRVTVCFKGPWGNYSRGDIAGFDSEKSTELIDRGIAVEGESLSTSEDADEVVV